MVAKKPVKKTVKKTVKKAPVKSAVKTAAKPRKRTTSKAATTRRAKAEQMKSFRIYREAGAFTNFSVTRQTIYWIILLIVIVIMQLWVLKIQLEIAELTTILISQT